MATLTIERDVAVPPQRLWEVITDWAGYARWMPMTTMRLDPGPTQFGWSFAGLSGVGRVRFSDTMVITAWAPPAEQRPGSFRLNKVGRLLGGFAEVTVRPTAGGDRTQLVWRESIVVRPAFVGRLLAPVSDRFNWWLIGRAVDAMTAEALRDPGRP